LPRRSKLRIWRIFLHGVESDQPAASGWIFLGSYFSSVFQMANLSCQP
jgi:hypothetical protein